MSLYGLKKEGYKNHFFITTEYLKIQIKIQNITYNFYKFVNSSISIIFTHVKYIRILIILIQSLLYAIGKALLLNFQVFCGFNLYL